MWAKYIGMATVLVQCPYTFAIITNSSSKASRGWPMRRLHGHLASAPEYPAFSWQTTAQIEYYPTKGGRSASLPNGHAIQGKSVRENLSASFLLRRPMPPQRRNARENAAIRCLRDALLNHGGVSHFGDLVSAAICRGCSDLGAWRFALTKRPLAKEGAKLRR